MSVVVNNAVRAITSRGITGGGISGLIGYFDLIQRLSTSGTFTRATPATYYNSVGVLSTAAINELRFDYDPVTLERRGAMFWGEINNKLPYSEEQDNAVWVKTNLDVTPNTETFPDGNVTMDKLIPTIASGGHFALQGSTIVSGTTYTHSVHAKADEYDFIQLTASTGWSGAASIWVNFNLATGTIGNFGGDAGMTYGIENIGNGVYRCWLTAEADTTSTGRMIHAVIDSDITARLSNFSGDGTSGIHLGGVQFETGSMSPYVPTLGASETSGADVATLPTAGWYNSTENLGAITCKFRQDALNTEARVFVLSDGTGDNRIIVRNYTGKLNVTTITGGVTQASMSTTYDIVSGQEYHLGVSWQANEVIFTVDGVTVGVDTTNTTPTGLSELAIGRGVFSTNYLNGAISTLPYHPTTKTEVQLQELTS